jgi:hypothetical protein
VGAGLAGDWHELSVAKKTSIAGKAGSHSKILI